MVVMRSGKKKRKESRSDRPIEWRRREK